MATVQGEILCKDEVEKGRESPETLSRAGRPSAGCRNRPTTDLRALGFSFSNSKTRTWPRNFALYMHTQYQGPGPEPIRKAGSWVDFTTIQRSNY